MRDDKTQQPKTSWLDRTMRFFTSFAAATPREIPADLAARRTVGSASAEDSDPTQEPMLPIKSN